MAFRGKIKTKEVLIMDRIEDKKLIGQKVKIEKERSYGVVTRIDQEHGLIYVMFSRMREEKYPYPEAVDQGILTPTGK